MAEFIQPNAHRDTSADARIQTKMNQAASAAFADKYENQIEHILRLLCERLQTGLDKRGSVDIADPGTWRLSPAEIVDLSESIHYIHAIRQQFKS